MKMGKWGQKWMVEVCIALAMASCDSMVGPEDPRDEFGSGIVVTDVRAVSGFTGVRAIATGGHTIVVEQTEVGGAEVTTDDNLIEFVRTEVIDETLVISVDPNVLLHPTDRLVVRVRAGELSTLIADGAVSLDVDIGSVPGLSVGVERQPTPSAAPPPGRLCSPAGPGSTSRAWPPG